MVGIYYPQFISPFYSFGIWASRLLSNLLKISELAINGVIRIPNFSHYTSLSLQKGEKCKLVITEGKPAGVQSITFSILQLSTSFLYIIFKGNKDWPWKRGNWVLYPENSGIMKSPGSDKWRIWVSVDLIIRKSHGIFPTNSRWSNSSEWHYGINKSQICVGLHLGPWWVTGPTLGFLGALSPDTIFFSTVFSPLV